MNDAACFAISQAIRKGTSFLKTHQHRDGSFGILISKDPELKKECKNDATHFATCLVLYCLGFIRDKHISSMIDSACTFLASGMEGSGYWRFWVRGKRRYARIALDVDDTACAAFLLQRFQKGFRADNQATLLANRDRNGLFYTWIFPRAGIFFKRAIWKIPVYDWFGLWVHRHLWTEAEADPNDIDTGVNANVLLYLGEGEHAQSVVKWLEEKLLLSEEALYEKWYVPLGIHYMISRAYYEGIKSLESLIPTLKLRIANEMGKAANSGHPLFSALAACSLLNIGCRADNPDLKSALAVLLATQEENGSWPAGPIFWGGPTHSICWGSPEVSTAFALEALARYENLDRGTP